MLRQGNYLHSSGLLRGGHDSVREVLIFSFDKLKSICVDQQFVREGINLEHYENLTQIIN